MEFIALAIIMLFIAAYIILSSIEFGASLFRLIPHALKGKQTVERYMGPVWEATNVFLVFALVFLFNFFPTAAANFGTHLLVPLFVTLLIFAVRITLTLIYFYSDYRHRLLDWLLLIVCFLGPIVFSSVFVFALSGPGVALFSSPLALSIDALVITTILLVSSSFFHYFERQADNHILHDLVSFFGLMWLLTAGILFGIMNNTQPHLVADWPVVVMGIAAVLVGYAGFWLAHHFDFRGHAFFNVCLMVGSLIYAIAILQLPYLIYPEVTVFSAFTDATVFQSTAISTGIGLLLVLPGLAYMYYIFVFSDPGKSEK